MEKEDIDLKEGETTPAEDDPSVEKPTEEKVEVSKSELEQLRKDAGEKENLRKAVIRLNRTKGHSLPESEPVKKPNTDDPNYEDNEDLKKRLSGDFVTREELNLRDDNLAISKACENEELAENWDEVIIFYTPPTKPSYSSKLSAITKAYNEWKVKRNIQPAKSKDEDVKRDLATDKGLSKGKEKPPVAKPREHIIKKKEGMEDWYGKADEK